MGRVSTVVSYTLVLVALVTVVLVARGLPRRVLAVSVADATITGSVSISLVVTLTNIGRVKRTGSISTVPISIAIPPGSGKCHASGCDSEGGHCHNSKSSLELVQNNLLLV